MASSNSDSTLERLQQCLVENAQLRLQIDTLSEYEREVKELRESNSIDERTATLEMQLALARRKCAEAEATAREHVELTDQLQQTIEALSLQQETANSQLRTALSSPAPEVEDQPPMLEEIEDALSLKAELDETKNKLEFTQIEVKALQDTLHRLVDEKSGLLELRESYVDRRVCATMVKQYIRTPPGKMRDQILHLLEQFLETDLSNKKLGVSENPARSFLEFLSNETTREDSPSPTAEATNESEIEQERDKSPPPF